MNTHHKPRQSSWPFYSLQQSKTMTLTIHAYLSGKAKKLHTIEIRNDGETIGFYERSQSTEIERKKREISSAEDLLVEIHRKHGEFTVRWDGKRSEKVIRDGNNVERGVIPRQFWERPSWR